MSLEIDSETLLTVKSLQSNHSVENQKRILSLIDTLSSYKGAIYCWNTLLRKNDKIIDIYQLPSEDTLSIVFICFRGIENFLTRDTQDRCSAEAAVMEQLSLEWIENLVYVEEFKSTYNIYLKKTAQIFVLCILCYYPKLSTTIFSKFLELISSKLDSEGSISVAAKVILFESLMLLDPYLVSRDVQLVCDELTRSTLIKDHLRDSSLPNLVELLNKILSNAFRDVSKYCEDIHQCFDVIGLYLNWIDVRFVFSPHFMQLLDNALTSTTCVSAVSFAVRTGVTNCILGLINKGMPHNEKLSILQTLWTKGLENHIINCPLLSYCLENKASTSEPAISKCLHSYSNLAGCSTTQLLELLKQLISAQKSEIPEQLLILEHIEKWVDFSLKLLSFCDPVIALPIFVAFKEYICFLKPHKSSLAFNSLVSLSDSRLTRLHLMLSTLLENMKYEPHTDDENSQFQESRHEVRALITNIAQLDAQLVLKFTYELVARAVELTCSLARESPSIREAPFKVFSTCEVALSNFYHIGEALKPVKGDFFGPSSDYRPAMLSTMDLLWRENCILSSFPDRRIQSLFFELVCRFDTYFLHKPEQLSIVLAAFFDERGLRNRCPELRNRCAYLVGRLIKTHKKTLAPATEQIIQQLGSFLEPITEPVVPQNLASEGPPRGFESHPLCSSSSSLGPAEQAHLYEAAAQLLISYREVNIDEGAPTVCQLYQMLMERVLHLLQPQQGQPFGALLGKVLQERDESWLESRAQLLRQTMEMVVRTTKVFNTPILVAQAWDLLLQMMDLCNKQVLLYLQLSESVPASAKLNTLLVIWAGSRAFHHRMINLCPDHECKKILDLIHATMSPSISFLEHYLQTNSQLLEVDWPVLCGMVRDTLPLICQSILKFKEHSLEFLAHYVIKLVGIIMQLTRRADSMQQLNTLAGSSRASPVATSVEVSSSVSQQSNSSTPAHIVEDRRLLIRNLMRLFETIALTFTKGNQVDFASLTLVLGGQHASECLTYLVEQSQFCLEQDEPIGLRSAFLFFQNVVLSCAQHPQYAGDFPLSKPLALNLLVPLIIHGPGLPAFRLQDAQYAMALDEFSACLMAIYMYLQEELLTHLQNVYFPRLQMPEEASQSFLRALHEAPSNVAVFQKFFREFYSAFR